MVTEKRTFFIDNVKKICLSYNTAMEAMAKFHSNPFTVKLKAGRYDESVTWQNIK